MLNCLIVGCGNIGQRHIQSLINSKKKINFFILEKNRIIFNDIKKIFKDRNHKFGLFQNLSDISEKHFDIVFFTTNSDSRYKLFKSLSLKKNIKYIIFEKVVFQSNLQFKNTLKILKKKKILSWVNCPRREMIFFKNLKNKIKYKNFFFMNFYGEDWNLCSNSIHFIDLFYFFIGKDKKINYHANLENKVLGSKRLGFYEAKGNIKLFTNNFKETLLLSDTKNVSKHNVLNIEYDEKKILVIMNNKKNNVLFYKKGKIYQKKTFIMPLQSQITLSVVKKILKKNNCDLPSLSESYNCHKFLFLIFNNFFKNILNKKIINCPIT